MEIKGWHVIVAALGIGAAWYLLKSSTAGPKLVSVPNATGAGAGVSATAPKPRTLWRGVPPSIGPTVEAGSGIKHF